MRSISRVLFTGLLPLVFAGTTHAQWVQMTLDSVRVERIKVDSSNLYIWTNSGCYLSTNEGTNLSLVNQRFYPSLIAHDLAGGTTFYQWGRAGVFYSTDGGISWDSAKSPECFIMRMTANSSESGVGIEIFVATAAPRVGDCGTYFSTDNGTSWSGLLWPGFPLAFLDTGINKKIYVAPPGGEGPGGVSVSTNSGESWKEMNSGLYDSTRWRSPEVFSILQVGTYLFAGTEFGVFLGNVGDTIWNPVNNGLPHGVYPSDTLKYSPVTQLVSSSTNIFALIDPYTPNPGIYLTTNNGLNWTNVGEGLPDSIFVFELAVDQLNLYASTNTNFTSQIDSIGVWRRPLSEMITSVERLSDAIPEDFSLRQNYPNPFNPSATIQYQLPTTSRVCLSVYNVLGQIVAQLVKGVEEVGYKSVTWNAPRFSSGIYFYRLEATSISDPSKTFTSVKKMVLMK